MCRPWIAQELAKKCTVLHCPDWASQKKIFVANQTAAVGHGLANFLVRPALAQNQMYPYSHNGWLAMVNKCNDKRYDQSPYLDKMLQINKHMIHERMAQSNFLMSQK